MKAAPPASPCTGVCRIEPATGLCRGCKRSLREIADWPMLSTPEKRALLRRLGERATDGGKR